MKALTKKIGLAFIIASTLTACESLLSSNIKVEPVKRYSNGKVLNLNRLEVNWAGNEKCKNLNPKYGVTNAIQKYALVALDTLGEK